jgi:hypothetical protein
VGIDFTQLDSKTTDLDLRIDSTCALYTSIFTASAKVTGSVQAISRSPVAPWLISFSGTRTIFLLSPYGRVNEPVEKELGAV